MNIILSVILVFVVISDVAFPVTIRFPTTLTLPVVPASREIVPPWAACIL